jgi:hypothetical protein
MTSIIINKVIDRVIHVLERWRGTPHIPDGYYREEAEWERVNKCGETSAASSDCPRCSGLEEKVKKHNADYDGRPASHWRFHCTQSCASCSTPRHPST